MRSFGTEISGHFIFEELILKLSLMHFRKYFEYNYRSIDLLKK